ncbi:MAG: isoprenylcysteine carboxylmethyltransferase family protein [Nitrospirae bacterium]|nr:isoprenylcysteine carboxylmethyltransferase family protein [Nitrospirota bacterium]
MLTDFLVIITILFWIVIPIFWIPVHFAIKFFKKLGLLTYLVPVVAWMPIAYLIYKNRIYLLQFRVDLPISLNISGALFLLFGIFLHIWTARLLGLWGIIGVPEVYYAVKERLVTEGPFSVVRHPTYLAHTFIFLGVFLVTGVISVGIMVLLDFIIVNAVIIPLEEKELLSRFGEEYKVYKKNIPARFFPWFRGK